MELPRTLPPTPSPMRSVLPTMSAQWYIYGYFNDTIEKTQEGWRFSGKQLVFQGPGIVGNLSVVGL